MNTQKFINKMKGIEQIFSLYISNEENIEENFQNIIQFFNDQKIIDNQYDFKLLLRLLLKIANNHHRTPNFFSKIERIFQIIEEKMRKQLTNHEIFELFKSNKRILLYLIQNQLLTVDESIASKMMKKSYLNRKYPQYFYPEIKNFLSEEENIIVEITEDFNTKREIGENDDYVCELIRKDLIDEFISFVNQNNLPLDSNIKKSIFETNLFLLNSHQTLISYAAFFGSTQIFKYLYKNKASITPNIWIPAIHSDNAELISEIEEIYNNMDEKSYQLIIEESILCHHNEMTNYIQNKYILNDKKLFKSLFEYCLSNINFSFIEPEFIEQSAFFLFCQYDYCELVNEFLQFKFIDVNEIIVFKIFIFFNTVFICFVFIEFFF